MNFTLPYFLPAFPECFVALMTGLTLLADLFLNQRHPRLTYGLTLFTCLGAILLTLNVFDYNTVITFNQSFILDHMGVLLKLFVLGLTALALIYSQSLIPNGTDQSSAHYVLLLFSVLGMMVLISAYSFITLFLGLELLSLPLYALIAINRQKKGASEAALKYFILGSLASACLLYGMSLVYGLTGSLSVGQVSVALGQLSFGDQPLLGIGLIFMLAAVAFKLGIVPFHMWVPDVYEGAPLPVALIIATAVKVAAFALFVRLFIEALGTATLQWTHLCMVLSILSMAVGNIAAIVQTNIRRMLAYSSMAHMGYLLLGFVSGTPAGFGASLFYVLVYALMSLVAFAILAFISTPSGEVNDIDDLRGLHQRHPWLAFLMLIVMFSMAGIPPSAGFFAKIAVLMALVHVHLVWLAALALLFAVMGAYYYLRVVKTMYFEPPIQNVESLKLEGTAKQLALSVNGLLLLVLGLLPVGLFHLCELVFQSGM